MSFGSVPSFGDEQVTGVLSALDSTLVLEANGASGSVINVSGTWVGTILVEGSNDRFNTMQNVTLWSPPVGFIATGLTTPGYYRLAAIAGFTQIRARMSAYTSGSVIVVLSASSGTATVAALSPNASSFKNSSSTNDGLGNAITSQTNGAQRALDVGIDVSGVQVDPRSIRVLTSADTVSIQALSLSGITVTGTLTSNIGTTGGLALDSTLTGGTLKTKLVDTGGTNTAVVSAGGALKIDGSAVTQPVSGTVTANAGTGNHTVVQSTASSLNAAIVGSSSNGATANPNPVIVGGRDDLGVVRTMYVDTVLADPNVYVTSTPIEADSTRDGTLFSANVEFTLPTGNTESNFFFIKNPSGSARMLYVNDITVDVLTKGHQATFRMYADPTTSANGTTSSITSLNVGGVTTSSMQAFTSPTASARGTRLRTFSSGQDSNSLIVGFNYGMLLQPNHTLLVTGTPEANNVSVACTLVWTETT